MKCRSRAAKPAAFAYERRRRTAFLTTVKAAAGRLL
jgi:hypothetical protein